jgi:hypothetical protein
MANLVFMGKTGLIGGEATKLDSIDGATLTDNDAAFVNVSNVQYIYRLDADSGAAESSPDIIAPVTNPGDKRWILQGLNGMGSSSFSAYLTADLDDCTGDSTAVEFKGAYWTETYDNGSVFSNGVFTAPATGFYLLGAQVYMSQLSSGHTYGSCELRISTGDIYYMFWGNPYAGSTSGEFSCLNSISIYLTSGQTANLYLFVAGGTKTVHVEGSSTKIWGYRLS